LEAEEVEDVAVPADDLTGEFSDALADATTRGEDQRDTEPESWDV